MKNEKPKEYTERNTVIDLHQSYLLRVIDFEPITLRNRFLLYVIDHLLQMRFVIDFVIESITNVIDFEPITLRNS